MPLPILIDEHGVVRKLGARWDDLEDFFASDFDAPAGQPRLQSPGAHSLPKLVDAQLTPTEERARASMSALLWDPEELTSDASADPVGTLVALAAAERGNAQAQFRAGVALRMRFDRNEGRHSTVEAGSEDLALRAAGDFQAAIDHWAAALALNPNQYIWRRRIQQYGPRLDKPYPFYTWVDEAFAALLERGVEAPPLVAELTPAELMQPRRGTGKAEAAKEPDPEGRITRDDGLIVARYAVAFDTGTAKDVAMVHVSLHPNDAREAHWNNEVEQTRIWLDQGALATGAVLDTHLLTSDLPADEISDEARRFSFEVTLPAGVKQVVVSGYALFHACEGIEGTCVYRRLDLKIPVSRP